MGTIVFDKYADANTLQNQEDEEIQVPAYEKKNISHSGSKLKKFQIQSPELNIVCIEHVPQ